MARPNWGRGLAAFGNTVQNYYGNQMQQEQADAEYQRRLEDQYALADYRHQQDLADWLFRQQYAAANTPPEPVDPMSLPYVGPPMQQPQGPDVSGGALPMTTGDPNLDQLSSIQEAGVPLTNKMAADFLLKAAMKQSGAGMQQPLIDFNLDPALGGGSYPVKPSDYPGLAMRQHGLLNPPVQPERTLSPGQIVNESAQFADRTWPVPRITKDRYGGDVVTYLPGYANVAEARALGESAIAALNAATDSSVREMGSNIGGWDSAPSNALMNFDIPDEMQFLDLVVPKDNQWIVNASIDDKGTATTADDEFVGGGVLGIGQKRMKVSEAVQKISEKAKKANPDKGERSVSYKAALEILEGLGIDPAEYQMMAPTSRMSPQESGSAPAVDFSSY